MKLRYVYSRGGIYYWQRRIPLDLRDRYGSKILKINLNTSDPRQVIRNVEALNSKIEAEWEAMRGNSKLTPIQARTTALKLLQQYGLHPLPHTNQDDDLDYFLSTVIYPKLETYAAGDEETYREAVPQDFLTPTEAAAVALLNVKPELLLSESLDIYLDGHKKANDAKFRTYTLRIWNTLIAAIGDKPFMEVSRADVNAYRDYVLAKGNKTTTVRRQINVIRAVFSVVIREKELSKHNPFEAVRIAGLGDDSIGRKPFTSAQLSTIKKAIVEADDDMRWIIGLQSDTGIRLAEAVGLALEDIKLDDPVPHLVIKPHPWRKLKTKNSERKVPLVGTSLWAAQRVMATARPGQVLAFTRYATMTANKADAASSALNNWMDSKGVPRTTHEFRHTLRDRLRAVNATKDVMDSIGGWSSQSIGDGYGEGYALRLMHEWLLKVV